MVHLILHFFALVGKNPPFAEKKFLTNCFFNKLLLILQL